MSFILFSVLPTFCNCVFSVLRKFPACCEDVFYCRHLLTVITKILSVLLRLLCPILNLLNTALSVFSPLYYYIYTVLNCMEMSVFYFFVPMLLPQLICLSPNNAFPF